MYFGYYSFYHYFICRYCNCLLFYLFSLNENSLIWTAFLVRIKFEKSKIFTKKQTKCPCRWRRIWPGCDKMMRRNQGLASWQKSETIAGNKGLNRTSGTKEKKKKEDSVRAWRDWPSLWARIRVVVVFMQFHWLLFECSLSSLWY